MPPPLALALAAGSAMAEFKDFTVNGELVTKAQQESVAAEALANNPNANQMIASPDLKIRSSRWSPNTK